LTLFGGFIEDSTGLGSNSALTGLADIAGTLDLGGTPLSIAGPLTNTGSIDLNEGLLDVTAGSAGFGSAGVLSGNVVLLYSSAIEFASGEISTIAPGASLSFYAGGLIEDSTALGSNSALTGLASIGAGAALSLNDASVSTNGSLVNNGSVSVGVISGFGGGSLTMAGALTNNGALNIGSVGSVTANSFVNSGAASLTGTSLQAALNVSGTLTNNGSISIATDTETLAGAVAGTGSFSLSNANLQFDSSVSSGQTITETDAPNALTLEQAQSFAATISGFGTGDTIDAANFLLSGTTFNFVENSGGTGGTLSLHDASLTANILMTGVYSNSDFTLAADSGTGTLVKFV
jgi:hypothetical protein